MTTGLASKLFPAEMGFAGKLELFHYSFVGITFHEHPLLNAALFCTNPMAGRRMKSLLKKPFQLPC